jgi:hypothetical protein
VFCRYFLTKNGKQGSVILMFFVRVFQPLNKIIGIEPESVKN